MTNDIRIETSDDFQRKWGWGNRLWDRRDEDFYLEVANDNGKVTHCDNAKVTHPGVKQ